MNSREFEVNRKINLEAQLGPVFESKGTDDSCRCLYCDPAQDVNSRKTTFDAIGSLEKEHESILKECTHLATTIMKLNRGGSRRLLRESRCCANLLKKTFAAHQASEEEVALSIIQELLRWEVVSSIFDEHRQISNTLKAMRDLVARLKPDSPQASIDAIKKLVAKFNSLTRVHFSHEENVLFWFASLYIDDSYSAKWLGPSRLQ